VKTTELIDLLAREAGPAPRLWTGPWLAAVALAGALTSALLALAWLGPIPAAMLSTPAPWAKLLYAALLAAGALWLAARLARPVARLRSPVRVLLGVAAAMALVGAAVLGAAPGADRAAALLGHSWASCPWNVLVLSLPALAGALGVVRRMAPTRLRAAGFAAGLLAGAAGAFGYALACNESSLAFVALWYSLGILLAGGVGALLGPRVLRW
jgi:hypothetical protein